MNLDEVERKQADDYELDVKMTLWSNTVYFVFAILYAVFLIQAFNMITTLPSDQRVLALMVFMFAFIKISSGWSNFNLEYRPRKENKYHEKKERENEDAK